MKTITRTAEEKKAYFEGVRKEWKAGKELAETLSFKEAYALACVGMEKPVSATSFTIVYKQMQDQGLDGFPFLDCATFSVWKARGRMVAKGSKSTIRGITFVSSTTRNKETGKKEEDKGGFSYPKTYHLFHRSQLKDLEK